MKRLLAAAALTAAMAITGACTSTEELARDFATPPETVQTGIYWYWISGNISEEGVVRDLHAMKRAGINRAFIGNIGQDGLYTERNVLMMSDEWWKILHTALKTASELDIEIGIFNSPGWSQSGGPWVKPDEAMRYLASAQIEVEGPRHIETSNRGPRCRFRGCAYDSLPRARRVCLASRRCHQDRLCGRQCRCHRRRRSGNGHNTACGPCQYHNIRLWKAIYGPLAHAQTSTLARSLRRTTRGRNRRHIYHRCRLYGRPFEPRHKCRVRSLRSSDGIVRRNDGTQVPPRDGCGGTVGRHSPKRSFRRSRA